MYIIKNIRCTRIQKNCEAKAKLFIVNIEVSSHIRTDRFIYLLPIIKPEHNKYRAIHKQPLISISTVL